MREWVREALDRWLGAGGGDFVPIAEMIPARALAHVLGLPDGDVTHFRRWAMMGGDMLAGDVSAARLHEFARETAAMAEYLAKHIEAVKAGREPAPDAPLLHALAHGVELGQLSFRDAVGISIVMFGAGGESTAALIGSAARVLAQSPTCADVLRGEPDLIPRFIEEVVRLESPFKFHYRAVRRACELGGFELEPGDRLMLCWSAANRDPDASRIRMRCGSTGATRSSTSASARRALLHRCAARAARSADRARAAARAHESRGARRRRSARARAQHLRAPARAAAARGRLMVGNASRCPYSIAPVSRSFARAAASKPSESSTSSVCSPFAGAGRRTVIGVSSNCTGLAASRAVGWVGWRGR
jgi:hypothetical protein